MRAAIYAVFAALVMVFAAVPVATAQYTWYFGPGWSPGTGWYLGPELDRGRLHSWYPGRGLAHERCADVWEDLSPERMDEIATIQRDHMKTQSELHARLRAMSRDMLELDGRESFDEDALQDLRKKIWEVEDKLREQDRQLDEKLLAVLSADARKRLGALEPSACLAYDARRGM
ncbi:MAG: hypothetical protein RDU20_09745 [Desulfomonilaceae bacterium]|nr:hypothetical protein [Desulfomonilaceae bacterium]